MNKKKVLIKIGSLHFLNFLLLLFMGVSWGNNAMAQDNEEARNGYSYYPQGDIVIANSINSRNIRWYKIQDRRRTEIEKMPMYVIYGEQNKDIYVNNGVGVDPDCLLWTFIKGDPSPGNPAITYYLYNKKCGFKIPVHRGWGTTKDDYRYIDGRTLKPGHDAYMIEEGKKKAFGFFSNFTGRRDREFSLVYRDDEGNGDQIRRFENRNNSNDLHFGQTNNWNTSSVIWTTIEVSATQTERFDYYSLINARGSLGALPVQDVNSLVEKHFVMESNPSETSTQAVKTEAAKLRSNSQSNYVAFDANKYYRIRAAHLGFFDPEKSDDVTTYYKQTGTSTWKRPVLYTNPNDNSVAWRLSDGDNSKEEELWKITLQSGDFTNGGVIVLTNKKTGRSLRITQMDTGAAPIGFKPVNSKYYPGHYQIWDKISGDGFTLHFTDHRSGMGTGGKTEFYKQGDNNSYDFFYDANTNKTNRIHGASVVIFDPSTVEVELPLTSEEKIDVWRLIWSKDQVNGISADNLKTLETLWKNGNPEQGDISKLRAEAAKLKDKKQTQRVGLDEKGRIPNGLYRFKNAHDGWFYDYATNTPRAEKKRALLFENASDHRQKWSVSATDNSTIYYVRQLANDKYEIINTTTGYGYTTAGQSSQKIEYNADRTRKTAPKEISIDPVNDARYPGYFKIAADDASSSYKYAHAKSHGNGNGTRDFTMQYDSPDNNDRDFFMPDNNRLPGASTWMLERLPETTKPIVNKDKVSAVLNAKNVVDGFTAAELVELERLEDIAREMNTDDASGTALNNEVERLLKKPLEERIQYADGFYVIKNGSYDYYERDYNKVLLMNAAQEGGDAIDRIQWKKKGVAEAGNDASEVWYVQKQANGLYTFTNLNTMTKIQGFNFVQNTSERKNYKSAFLAGKDAQIKVSFVDQANRPAQLLLQTNTTGNNNDITANPENPGTTFDGEQTGPILTWYGDPMDSHSTWMLRKVEETTFKTILPRQSTVKTSFERSENKYGGFTTEQLTKLKTITNPYELVKEINHLRTLTRIVSADGFVRISNASTCFAKPKHIYLDYAANNVKWHDHNNTLVDEIWVLGGGLASSKRTLQHPNTKTYINNVNGDMGALATMDVIAIEPDLFPGIFEIRFNNNVNETLHYLGHSNGASEKGDMSNYRYTSGETFYYCWAASDGTADFISQFSTSYIEKATQIDIVPKATAQWTTFNYPFAVKMPTPFADINASEGIWACIENTDVFSNPNLKTNVQVKPLSGQYVEKETPMVVEMKPAKSITLEIIQDISGVPSSELITQKSTLWEGTLAPKNVEVGDYVIRNLAQGNGWYPITGSPLVSANKVYLPKSKAVAASKFFTLEFTDRNTTTGIGAMQSNDEVIKDMIYYDLSGRRVVNPAKGIYITSEGKKVVFK
ncbi:MAG: hypothetical protein MSG77_03830 [Prevotella sp.]|nr:hypothetical protein [Prevotella sp.]